MTDFNVTNLPSASASSIANALDKKDGKADGKIDASIWNEFISDKGGKTIQYSITIENATKSIETYLTRNSESTGESKKSMALTLFLKTFGTNETAAETIEKPGMDEEVETTEESEIPQETSETREEAEFIERNNKRRIAERAAEEYVLNKYGNYYSMMYPAGAGDKCAYVDVDGDDNYDVAFTNKGTLVYDLLGTPAPPKGYAQKSVWYNPLTWF